MARITTVMPEVGWWQVALDVEGDPVLTAQQAVEVVDACLPERPDLAIHPSSDHGIWLVELPVDVAAQLMQEHYLLVEVGPYGLSADY